jgi:hypothetical protein
MIPFDTSRRPSRPSEWDGFVRALVQADGKDESYSLEFKSRLDWGKSFDLGTLARAILAMANRDPQQSLASFGGSGIVCVGLEPGEVHGVEPLDPAVLDGKLAPYTGTSDGPGWVPRWFDLDGKHVLVIEVDAPKFGDPPYTLRQSFGDYRKSQVFVRERGSSDPASQAHLERLARRFTSGPKTLDVEVGVKLEHPISPYFWDSNDIELFLENEKAELLLSLVLAETSEGSEPNKSFGKSTSAVSAMLGDGLRDIRLENRTPDEFRRAVDSYIRELREALPEALKTQLPELIEPPTFWITNRAERNFKKVNVTVRVEGQVSAGERTPPSINEDRTVAGRLPSRPRPFGSYTALTALGETLLRAGQRPVFMPDIYSAGLPFSRREIRNGGSFELDFDTVTLRPGANMVELESAVVIQVPRDRTEPVVVSWHATASNVDAVARGRFEVPIEGVPLDIFAESGLK